MGVGLRHQRIIHVRMTAISSAVGYADFATDVCHWPQGRGTMHLPQNSTDWRVREADLPKAAPVKLKLPMKNTLMGMLAKAVMTVMMAGGHTMFCTCMP